MRAQRGTRQHGVALILVAGGMTALLGVAALGIDLAFLMQVQSQLQNVADAVSLSAVSGLTVSLDDEATKQEEARRRGAEYAARNMVLGESINLNEQAPMEFGQWDPVFKTLLVDATPTNSVCVRLELTENTIPPAPALFFAPVLGHGTSTVVASSTATLGAGRRDLILAMDRSGSMRRNTLQGGPPQPLTDVLRAAKQFLALLEAGQAGAYQVGLVSYARQATLDAALTLEDFTPLEAVIDAYKARGNTNMAGALCQARQELLSDRARDGALRVTVLLADGEANRLILNAEACGSQGRHDPDEARQQALEQATLMSDAGLLLYTISFGENADQTLMEDLAAETGGRHFVAPDEEELGRIFSQIAVEIGQALVDGRC